MKFALSIWSLLSFVLGSFICSLLYDANIDPIGWDDLRHNFYALSILLFSVCSLMKTVLPLTDLFIYLSIGYSICNVADRFAFRIYNFTNLDYFTIPIVFTICLLIYGTKHPRKKTV